jgi:hypothetical protein
MLENLLRVHLQLERELIISNKSLFIIIYIIFFAIMSGIDAAGLSIIIGSVFIGLGTVIGITKRDLIKCTCCCITMEQARPQQSIQATSPREQQSVMTGQVNEATNEVENNVNRLSKAKSVFLKMKKIDRASSEP